MSRKPRIHVPGGVYHVMPRGNGGRAFLADPAERIERLNNAIMHD